MSSDAGSSELMVLMFTDVFDSVAMKRRLGDKRYYKLLSRHNELFSAIAAANQGVQIIKATGDGFLVRMPSASAAATVAIAFQAALADEPWAPEPVLVRTGIHVGEAMAVAGLRGEPDLSGLAVDVAARIMSLAMPGQVLLTRTAFDDARQYVRTGSVGADGSRPADVRWLAHGPYVVKGSEEPLEVYEVGTVGKAPLRAPPDSDKARRSIRVEDEELLGWRPGPKLPVRGRPAWLIERKLGEGGFGEVWLVQHEKTLEQRVLKFCFDADKLRFLRRELTLFRVLREALGDRRDIVRIHDVHLDKPPYYLEIAYSEDGSLLEWAAARGGLGGVPLEDRVRIIARVADAVAAAHGVGILHKDLKPANILMYRGDEGEIRPRLSDFGIGAFADDRSTKGKNITMAGFTMGPHSTEAASSTGTPMYMPPEVLAGKPFTTQGDVYALGVMLYQMVVGDLHKALGHGWEGDIADRELRDDIRRCVAAGVGDRFASAEQLARHLRTLTERRRRRVRRTALRVGAVSVSVLAVVAGLVMWIAGERRAMNEEAARRAEAEKSADVERGLRVEADKARQQAESAKQEAEAARDQAESARVRAEALAKLLRVMLEAPDPLRGRQGVTPMTAMLDAAEKFITDSALEQPELFAEATLLLAKTNLGLGRPAPAVKLLGLVVKQREAAAGGAADARALAEALHWQAYALRDNQQFSESAEVFKQALELRRALRGDNRLEVAQTAYEYGSALRSLKVFQEAEKLMVESVRIREHFPDDKDVQVEVARSYNSLCSLSMDRGEFAEAEKRAFKSLELRQRWLSKGHRDIARSMMALGRLWRESGRFDRAEAQFRAALVDLERGAGASEVLGAKIEIGRTLIDRGVPGEAEEIAGEALDGRRGEARDAGREAWPLADAKILMGTVLVRTGRAVEAEGLLREALKTAQAVWAKMPDHWQVATAQGALGEALMAIGKLDEAGPLLRASARVWETEKRSPLRTREAMKRMADWCDAAGKAGEAEAWRAKLRAPGGDGAGARPGPAGGG